MKTAEFSKNFQWHGACWVSSPGYRSCPWWRHNMETFSALLAICAGKSRVNFTHKGQWRGALMFSLICVWINGWVNNRKAGDLRRTNAHYDVTVMHGISRGKKYWIPVVFCHVLFCFIASVSHALLGLVLQQDFMTVVLLSTHVVIRIRHVMSCVVSVLFCSKFERLLSGFVVMSCFFSR